MQKNQGLGAGPILVTGGTGFIGRHVIRALVASGFQVRALVRRSSLRQGIWSDGFRANQDLTWFEGDLLDLSSLSAAMAGATAVVHCAALVGDHGNQKLYRRTNVEATKELQRLAAAQGCRRFVYMSSLGVYEARDHFGTDEATPAGIIGFDPYTDTKIEAEKSVLADAANGSAAALTTIVLRPGFTYGEGDQILLPRLIRALQDRRLVYFGTGLQKLNNTNVTNLAGAVVLALTKPFASGVGHVFNITDARLVTKREFIGTVARLLNLKLPQMMIPRPFMLTLTKLYEAWTAGEGRKDEPALSMARYKFMALNLDFSIEKAKQTLGYAPQIDFQEGIAAALADKLHGGATPQ